MKIAVLGANGRSGRVFVAAALDAGHDVVAGVRTKQDIDSFAPAKSLRVVVCDVLVQKDIDAIIADVDAVVSLIGHGKGTPKLLQTDAMTNIVRAMNSHRVRRLVSLTGTGARVAGDVPSLLDKVLTAAVTTVDPARMHDGSAHMSVLAASEQIDWTVLRVLKLTNGAAGSYALTPHGPGKLFVPRQEVAHAILDIIETELYISEYPIISPPQQS